MMVVVFVCCVFCLLVGSLIGFLFYSLPQLNFKLTDLNVSLRTIEKNTAESSYYLRKLYELQVQAEKEAGGLPAGVYEELPDGRLVNVNKPGHNGTVLPGGLSVSGIRPSEVQT